MCQNSNCLWAVYTAAPGSDFELYYFKSTAQGRATKIMADLRRGGELWGHQVIYMVEITNGDEAPRVITKKNLEQWPRKLLEYDVTNDKWSESITT